MLSTGEEGQQVWTYIGGYDTVDALRTEFLNSYPFHRAKNFEKARAERERLEAKLGHRSAPGYGVRRQEEVQESTAQAAPAS